MIPIVSLVRIPLVTAILCTAPPAPPATAPGQGTNDDLLCMFAASVDAYVQLHRRLEATVPPHTYTSDVETLLMSRQAMAFAIRRERASAKEGDIFSPEIAALFRQIVERTLREDRVDWADFLVQDGMTLPIEVRVNGDYPAGGPVATMTPTILKALPRLPAELQYRFVNMTLVLWDFHAGLIVDFVPDIFRPTTDPMPAR